MDRLQGFAETTDRNVMGADDAAIDAPPAIGTDERRMHVRVYNYWVSLLSGRVYPSVEDLGSGPIEGICKTVAI